MKPLNTQCRLAARPTGLPKATDFTIVDEPVPAAADGEFVVEIDYLSIVKSVALGRPVGRAASRHCVFTGFIKRSPA